MNSTALQTLLYLAIGLLMAEGSLRAMRDKRRPFGMGAYLWITLAWPLMLTVVAVKSIWRAVRG
jgi:hypothetical protein